MNFCENCTTILLSAASSEQKIPRDTNHVGIGRIPKRTGLSTTQRTVAPTFFYRRPHQRGPGAQTRSQSDSLPQRTAKRVRAERVHTTRLAIGAGKESQRECRSGPQGWQMVATPRQHWPLAVPVRSKHIRLAAKKRAAAKDRSAYNRRV